MVMINNVNGEIYSAYSWDIVEHDVFAAAKNDHSNEGLLGQFLG